jgi:hypothetical protein
VRRVSQVDAERKPRVWITVLIIFLIGALITVVSVFLWRTRLKLDRATPKSNPVPVTPAANIPSGPSGGSAPKRLASGPSGGRAPQTTSCQIVPTTSNWNLPGQILVKVNGESAGAFTVGAKGNAGLKLACQMGENSVQMTESGYSGVCSLSIVAAKGPNLFVPALHLASGAEPSCSLVPTASPNGTSPASAKP